MHCVEKGGKDVCRFKKNDQRQLIILKAMEYVKNGTYEPLSIRDFCTEAGITTGIFNATLPPRNLCFVIVIPCFWKK